MADDDDSEEENGNLSCGISSTLNYAEAEAIEVPMGEHIIMGSKPDQKLGRRQDIIQFDDKKANDETIPECSPTGGHATYHMSPRWKSTGWVRWLTGNWGNQSTIRRELTNKSREEAAEEKCWREELRYEDDENLLPIWEASINVELIEYV
ncbi:hypothetical protein M431DRAFT_529428 [Trichoderma harzianum CBS 226.95]|uniref:Uncharacterized protein n=1 Tax=Trichoderma harzianum CBS 226.95 TaxID=983964 RepID=A0A2T4AHT2_TRIHA|nr:hypothetical protein M431DRAFT_529428 [Trichoderma harzianum CBS 226.95]PTB56606.1 hypothetical protein M431DRAFT_529428 [Trichoderma harzianum CBS 226.95]